MAIEKKEETKIEEEVDPKVVEQKVEAAAAGEKPTVTLQDAIDKLPPDERRFAEVLQNRGFDMLEVRGVDPDMVVRFVNVKKENLDLKMSRGWVPVSRTEDGKLKKLKVGADWF